MSSSQELATIMIERQMNKLSLVPEIFERERGLDVVD